MSWYKCYLSANISGYDITLMPTQGQSTVQWVKRVSYDRWYIYGMIIGCWEVVLPSPGWWLWPEWRGGSFGLHICRDKETQTWIRAASSSLLLSVNLWHTGPKWMPFLCQPHSILIVCFFYSLSNLLLFNAGWHQNGSPQLSLRRIVKGMVHLIYKLYLKAVFFLRKVQWRYWFLWKTFVFNVKHVLNSKK